MSPFPGSSRAVKLIKMTARLFTRFRCVFKPDSFRTSSVRVQKCQFNTLDVLSVVYNQYGDPNKVLQTEKSQLSGPLKGNEVLVKMLMAPVNPSDINMIEGSYFLKPPLPAVVGNEGVAEVKEVGSRVTTLKAGDWVIPSQAGFGTWRTYAVTGETNLKKISNDIPPLSAATIAVNPCTAYRMLKDFVHLKAGDTVIQNAANSAVGQSVIQIAKAWNINTINIVRDRENLNELEEQLKSIGASHVVTEEYLRTPEMKSRVKSLKKPPKLALNGVGGKSATEMLRHIKRKGVMVTYGGMSRQPVIVPTGVFIFKEVTAVGYWNSQWNVENADSPEREKMFEDLCQMIRECKLIPPRSEIFALENYTEAVKSAMSGFQEKKKILSMQEFQ